jgi:hypothetical protein
VLGGVGIAGGVIAAGGGATIGEVSRKLNRPVSMFQIVLKLLGSEGKVGTQRRGMQQVYCLR